MAGDEAAPSTRAPRRERPPDAFDRAVVGMAVVGIDSAWKRVNPALCRMLARPEGDLLGNDYLAHIHPDDGVAPVEAALRMLSGEIDDWRTNRRFVRPDGTVAHLTCTARALHGDGGKPYFFLQFEDIGGEVSAQQQARDSQQWLKRVLAHSPITLIAFNLEGRVLLVEGQSPPNPDRLVLQRGSSSPSVDVQLAAYPAMVDAYHRAVAGETVQYTIDDHGKTFDVLCEPVRSSDGMIAYILSIATDVTDRARADADLRTWSAQQSVLADLGRLALERVELSQLRQHATDAVCSMLGVDVCGIFEHGHGLMRLVGSTGFGIEPDEELTFGDDHRTPTVLALRTGTVVTSFDLANDPRFEVAGLLEHHRAVSAMAVPIGRPDDQLGAMECFSRTPRAFDELEQAFLQNVSYVLGAATLRLRGEEEIRHRAVHDELTGLPNRTLLVDRLGVALARSRRGPDAVTVVYVDLDGFKTVNDTLGHASGDDLLRSVAQRLREVVRPGDTVARLAGDEFAILCEDLGGPGAAVRLAQRILTAVGGPVVLLDREFAMTASVGLAMSGPDADEPETLLRDADLAMYAAKRQGKGRYEAFDQVMRARVSRRVEIENDLRKALVNGQLRLAYQPILAVGGDMIGVEALMRWNHPRRGAVPPTEFVPLAEEAGLIVPLGAWALLEACRTADAFDVHPANGRPFRMAVNVSARQLADPGIVAAVTTAIEECHFGNAYQLCVEITETTLMEHVEIVTPVLAELRELGVLVAIDDFGTGYSSLSRLRHLPVDCLKIDSSFITGLGIDPADEAIVETVIRLAHALDLEVVAEGVETAAQLAALRSLGCDLVQGHYVAPPEIDLRTALARGAIR